MRATQVSKREVLDIIRRGLLGCGVDHDDTEIFASRVLEELIKAGVVAEGDPTGREYILERINGEARGYVREADGSTRDLKHVVCHSPDGFEWGYGGSGPADLALSILCDLLPENEAEQLYQDFKWQVIAQIPRSGGVIGAADVLDWVKKQRERRMKRLEESEIQQLNLEGGEPVE